MSRAGRWGVGLLVAFAVAAAAVAWLNLRDESPIGAAASTSAALDAAQVARGAYLATAGNCAGCHTARGGAPYAGGRAIVTPFGTVQAGNLTPDADTGLGRWNADEFWRALHNGRSRDGRLLYPAFPYPNYTRVSRADADALFAFLRSLAPVRQANRPHQLRFPYDSQVALALWRALFFRPGVHQDDAARSAAWNRGAYLVGGLGHCSACHGGRNALGGNAGHAAFGGGAIPMQGWYAPSLSSPAEAGVADWPEAEVVALLKNGVTPRASVLGPMASVVYRSTQHLGDDDLRAMANYLKSLPATPAPAAEPRPRDDAQMALGAQLYRRHCADCHGAEGEGAIGAIPPLAGNRAVTLASPANLLRVLLDGGFAPATAGNPRPYGMPPAALSDEELAAVISHLRGAWGNDAPPVTAREVLMLRELR